MAKKATHTKQAPSHKSASVAQRKAHAGTRARHAAPLPVKTARSEPVPAPFVDRGEPLPRAYARNRIVPLVRDPEHIWVYWDVETEVRVAARPLLVRIHCLSEERHWDLHPGTEADNWYLRLAPDRTYRFELFERRAGGLRLLATSREATTPLRWSSQSAGELPAEMIHAEIHPLTRAAAQPPAAAGAPQAAPLRMGKAQAGAWARHALSVRMHMKRATPVKPHRAPRSAPPSPAPVPVPPTYPRVFSKEYASGRGK